jgi:hypothetical protein
MGKVLADKPCKYYESRLEAATGVEPVMEVLELSDGRDGRWSSMRKSAAKSKILRRLDVVPSPGVTARVESSRQQLVGSGRRELKAECVSPAHVYQVAPER